MNSATNQSSTTNQVTYNSYNFLNTTYKTYNHATQLHLDIRVLNQLNKEELVAYIFLKHLQQTLDTSEPVVINHLHITNNLNSQIEAPRTFKNKMISALESLSERKLLKLIPIKTPFYNETAKSKRQYLLYPQTNENSLYNNFNTYVEPRYNLILNSNTYYFIVKNIGFTNTNLGINLINYYIQMRILFKLRKSQTAKYTIKQLSKLFNIHTNSILKYNKILIENNLLYKAQSKILKDEHRAIIIGLPNIYAEPDNKMECNREYTVLINKYRKFTTKLCDRIKGNALKSLIMRYYAFCRKPELYAPGTIVQMYKDIVQLNQYYTNHFTPLKCKQHIKDINPFIRYFEYNEINF